MDQADEQVSWASSYSTARFRAAADAVDREGHPSGRWVRALAYAPPRVREAIVRGLTEPVELERLRSPGYSAPVAALLTRCDELDRWARPGESACVPTATVRALLGVEGNRDPDCG